MDEAKKILLSAQALNSNDWYGAQFQKGLEEISFLSSGDQTSASTMRSVPQIILSLSEVCIMMNGQPQDKILKVQNKLWKLHFQE